MKVEKTINRETYLWIFCITIVLLLSVKVTLDSQDFSCSECSITLVNTMAGGSSFEFGNFNVEELFNEYYHEGHCAIGWDPTQGYVMNG